MLGSVSDGYIRLIPTDRDRQPTAEGAAAAATYVTRLSPAEDDVEEVNMSSGYSAAPGPN